MTETQVVTAVKADASASLSWLKVHERLIIVILVLAVSGWLGNHWLNNRAEVADQKVVAAQQALDAQKTANTQLAAQVQQTTAQYQAMVNSLTQQNSQLTSAMQSRTVVLQQQQTVDKTLPLPDLGTRWSTLANLQPGDLTATTSGVNLTDAGARATVSTLEQVPALTSNLADETKVADNRQAEVNEANVLVDGLNQQVTGLNLQITDGDKTCNTKLAAVKADAAKAKKNWFLRGLGIGATVAIFIAEKL
jgi:Tfp pilus assembly protein FimV